MAGAVMATAAGTDIAAAMRVAERTVEAIAADTLDADMSAEVHAAGLAAAPAVGSVAERAVDLAAVADT